MQTKEIDSNALSEFILEDDGQLTFGLFDNEITSIYQSNALVEAQQTMESNYSARILRLAIMQINKNDQDFKPYQVSLSQLSSLLGVTKGNLSRCMDTITSDLMGYVIFKKITPKRVRLIKLPYCSICDYDSDRGLAIQLNSKLKTYLLGLKNNMTITDGIDVMSLKNNYSLRIYELLMDKIFISSFSEQGTCVDLTIENIRFALGIENKYKKSTDFCIHILDKACRDINNNTYFRISYLRLKENSNHYDTVRFFVNRSINIGHGWDGKEPDGFEYPIQENSSK